MIRNHNDFNYGFTYFHPILRVGKKFWNFRGRRDGKFQRQGRNLLGGINFSGSGKRGTGKSDANVILKVILI